jgi:hypothetical protein
MSTNDAVKANSKYHLLDFMIEIELADPNTYSPTKELKPGDEVLTDISEDTWLRKAFCLAVQYRRDAIILAANIELFENKKDEKTQEKLAYRTNILIDLAWHAVRCQYNLWNTGLALCRGWKIIRRRES